MNLTKAEVLDIMNVRSDSGHHQDEEIIRLLIADWLKQNEALAFYGDEENWKPTKDYDYCPPAIEDNGAKARECIK